MQLQPFIYNLIEMFANSILAERVDKWGVILSQGYMQHTREDN